MKGDSPKQLRCPIPPFDVVVQAIIKFSCLFLVHNHFLLISGFIITAMLFLVNHIISNGLVVRSAFLKGSLRLPKV